MFNGCVSGVLIDLMCMMCIHYAQLNAHTVIWGKPVGTGITERTIKGARYLSIPLLTCTPGSASGPTLGKEYGKPLPLPFYLTSKIVGQLANQADLENGH